MKRTFAMRAAFLITAITLLASMLYAQAPQKMSYQAIVRDVSNNLVTNTNIGMKITILKDSPSGTPSYIETHTTTTNANGLATIEIGDGNIISGANFSNINWSNGPYFIKVETDLAGGNNYTISGTSELISVPYALYAAASGSSTPGPQGEKGDKGDKGDTGSQGAQGAIGNDGISAYQVAVNNGFVGTEVQWLASLVGPQGLQGIQGLKGDKGDKGDTGAQGLQGIQGVKGDKGDTGVQGIQGAKGDTGAQGPKGDKGDTGATGPQGIQGLTGSTGATGLQGTAGINGTAVLNGNINPTNAIGVNGDFYINTTTNTLFGPKASGVWPSGISLVGPQGLQGLQGAQGIQGPQGLAGATGATGPQGTAGINGTAVLNGNTNPTNAIGVNGDFYINTTTNTLFGPKASGVWPSGISLVGPQGLQGLQGPQGLQGLTGATGATGATGPQGPAGISGVVSARKTADETVTASTTFQNDDQLTLNLQAGKLYYIKGVLLLRRGNAGTGDGVKFNFSYSGTVANLTQVLFSGAGDPTNTGFINDYVLNNIGSTTLGLTSQTTFEFFITPTTSGTLTLRWAQVQTTNNNPTILGTGSIMYGMPLN